MCFRNLTGCLSRNQHESVKGNSLFTNVHELRLSLRLAVNKLLKRVVRGIVYLNVIPDAQTNDIELFLYFVNKVYWVVIRYKCYNLYQCFIYYKNPYN